MSGLTHASNQKHHRKCIGAISLLLVIMLSGACNGLESSEVIQQWKDSGDLIDRNEASESPMSEEDIGQYCQQVVSEAITLLAADIRVLGIDHINLKNCTSYSVGPDKDGGYRVECSLIGLTRNQENTQENTESYKDLPTEQLLKIYQKENQIVFCDFFDNKESDLFNGFMNLKAMQDELEKRNEERPQGLVKYEIQVNSTKNQSEESSDQNQINSLTLIISHL